MISRKQIEANRRNALKSTGPKSQAGKATSSMNAVRHGLTATQVVIAGEDPEEYNQLADSLREKFTPVDSLELRLVEQLAQQLWRLRRVSHFECALLNWLQRGELLKDRSALPTTRLKGSHFRLPASPREVPQESSGSGRAIKSDDSDFHDLNALGRTVERALGKQDYFNKLSRYESALLRDTNRTLQLLFQIKDREKTGCESAQKGDRSSQAKLIQ